MNICFYISDYGYGHASRAIAVIRKILTFCKNIKIYVKTDTAFDFVRQSLPQENIEVIRTKNDIGVIFKENSVVVDRANTKKALDGWINSWENYIHREKRFCESHKIDLILSDITPQAFIVAEELNIPGIAISNFTWHYIFYYLFGTVPETERIKEAYHCADLALVLPFNEEMDIFKKKEEVSLVSREITASKYSMRKKWGIPDDELLAYISVGRSFDPSFLRDMEWIDKPDVKFLITSSTEIPFDNVLRVPGTETEMQNYINMCDFVVSKTGYGTASEAIRAKIPMFLLKRDGFKEDELIGNMVEKLGIGKFIPKKEFLGGEWSRELNELTSYKDQFNKIPKRFVDDGIPDIIKILTDNNYLLHEKSYEAY